MAEIAAVNAAMQPVETLLVVDAMTGQEAVGVAQAFAAAVPVTGLILTKIDGDARGGAALSIATVTGVGGEVPGHRREDRRARGLPPGPAGRPHPGHGRRADARRAGPGDVDAEQAERWRRSSARPSSRSRTSSSSSSRSRRWARSASSWACCPGMGDMAKDAQAAVDRGELKRTEAIIRSMTHARAARPGVLTGSRRRRIATRLRDVADGGQPAHQAVLGDAADDEAARGRRGRGLLGGLSIGRR